MRDIFRDEWIDGYRVTAFPFKDKIFTNIEYFKPGSSLSRPPVWEFTLYLSQDAEPTLRNYPTSVIRNLVAIYFANKRKE